MALTINSNPQNRISNIASFNVSTDIVEGSSYNNVRIRAEVYFEGEVIAVIEKPKGLNVFDFSEILKTRIQGLKKARHTTDAIETGSVGPQIITAISTYSGVWTTFTTTGNQITAAICTDLSVLRSQYFQTVAGEMYMLVVKDLVSTGVNTPKVELMSQIGVSEEIEKNKTYLFMCGYTGTNALDIGNNTALDFSGTFELYKITTDRDTVGQLLVPYVVRFKEVYEDASGVTWDLAPTFTQLYRYVPAATGIDFTDYVLFNSYSNFANLNFRGEVIKYYSAKNIELRIVFFSERYAMELERKLNGAGVWSGYEYIWNYEGWGVVILNSNSLSGLTSQVLYRIMDTENATVVSEELLIVNDTGCLDNLVILECTGLTGGLEAFPFFNLPSGRFAVDRKFYTLQSGARRPVSFKGVNRYTLRTKFKDMYFTDFLVGLLLATDVVALQEGDDAVDVTVVNDTGIVSSDEMFLNDIEIEFDYGY